MTTQFPEYGCMDNLTTKRSFDSQAPRVIDMVGVYLLLHLWLAVCSVSYFI